MPIPSDYFQYSMVDFLNSWFINFGLWLGSLQMTFWIIWIWIWNLQTTRIFAPWFNEGCLTNGDSWHEIARPQVHGHDINCITIVQGRGNHCFVSGAEEKVARVFEAPLSFLKTLSYATSQLSDIHEDIQRDVQILGANMSALGLSQKPIYVHGDSLLFFFFLSRKEWLPYSSIKPCWIFISNGPGYDVQTLIILLCILGELISLHIIHISYCPLPVTRFWQWLLRLLPSCC